MFFAKKSIPTVGYVKEYSYMRSLLKFVMNVFFDDAWLSNILITQENNFYFDLAW